MSKLLRDFIFGLLPMLLVIGVAAGVSAQTGSDTLKISALSGKWSEFYNSLDYVDSVESGGKSSRVLTEYRFLSGGAVAMTMRADVATGDCRLQISHSLKGRAILNGDKLVIKWLPSQFNVKNLCDASKSYHKTLPAAVETFRVSSETRRDQKLLCLKDDKRQSKACYFPAKK